MDSLRSSSKWAAGYGLGAVYPPSKLLRVRQSSCLSSLVHQVGPARRLTRKKPGWLSTKSDSSGFVVPSSDSHPIGAFIDHQREELKIAQRDGSIMFAAYDVRDISLLCLCAGIFACSCFNRTPAGSLYFFILHPTAYLRAKKLYRWHKQTRAPSTNLLDTPLAALRCRPNTTNGRRVPTMRMMILKKAFS